MTKSEMRRLQFQRKYTSNEQYENDKARLINILIGGGVEDFAVNLLNQSKWIGAVDPAYDEGYSDGYIDGGNDWD